MSSEPLRGRRTPAAGATRARPRRAPEAAGPIPVTPTGKGRTVTGADADRAVAEAARQLATRCYLDKLGQALRVLDQAALLACFTEREEITRGLAQAYRACERTYNVADELVIAHA